MKLWAIALSSLLSASATVVASVNASGPAGYGPSYQFVSPDIGWLYTAPFTFTADEVDFHFSNTDFNTVTEEIFSDNPPSLGGTLLRSATFSSSVGFTGGTFAPLTFVAGNSYFIGALGILNFDGMTSTDGSAVLLPEYSDSGSGNFDIPCTGCPSSPRIMLEFVNTSVPTPEPSSLVLLGLGCGSVIRMIKRK